MPRPIGILIGNAILHEIRIAIGNFIAKGIRIYYRVPLA